MKKAIIKSMVLGPVATNCILIKNSETKELLIVDPADQAGDISQAVTLLDGQPVGILLTHGHYDHIAAVSELWRAAHILQKKLNIFCSEETFAEVKTCFPYFFKSNHESGSDQIIWNVLQENQEFEFAGIKWQTFQNKHGHMSTTAYRHKKLAVVMDLEELSDTNKTRLHNLDLLIIECNNGQDDKARNGHNNLRNILNWTAELKPKKTLLTHLSTRVDYNEVSQTLPPEIELAYDGMTLEI